MAKTKKKKKQSDQENDPRQASTRFEEEIIDVPEVMPVLPAKDLVAFPSVMMSLYVGRPSSVSAIEAAMERDNLILIVAQKDLDKEDPESRDLFRVGVVTHIVRTLKLPDGRYKVLLQGIVRARAQRFMRSKSFLECKIDALPNPDSVELSAEDEVLINRIRENLQVLVQYEHLPEEMLLVTEEVQDAAVLSDVILAHYKLDHFVAQSALEELDPVKRLKITDQIITDDLNQFLISEKIRDKTRDELSKGQREYYLREQIKQIQRELGEEDSGSDETAPLREALLKAKMPATAWSEAERQLKRLERMPVESSEHALLRTYLDWLAELPWSKRSRDSLDLREAAEILDRDHYGLEKVKERILEYLSVRKLNKDTKGPILCFVGPPGVGKTSLGKSIAQALQRQFFRMSLGGVRDEAEIRGHRRTYVGAMPGRVLQGMKQAGTRNPVFVLDELDKVGADFRGDPSSALLEVLDPQQNNEFQDHYLNLPFDLSEVLFIATANTTDTIPQALLDRLEVIRISGYTTQEKIKIAERYLVPRQLQENGLAGQDVRFNEAALLFVIEHFTREAGVRNLEREIAGLCRKLAREFAESNKLRKRITPQIVSKLLGATKYDHDSDERKDLIGVARGLAWTVYGGEMMPIEVSVAKGKGALALTGQLGSVMQESAQAAMFYARSNAKALGLDPNFYENLDIHVHVPSGATPKDGPSAGITIAVALVSALSQRKVSRGVTMTGEITLRGNVLPVGGIKEKALAALRYDIKKVIIPFENIKDLEEVPKEQRAQLKFIPVKHISEVLEIALLGKSGATGIRPRAKRKRGTSISGQV